MEEKLLKAYYHLYINYKNKKFYGCYILGNSLRVDGLYEEKSENLDWIKKFPNIYEKLKRRETLHVYYDLDLLRYVAEIGHTVHLGPYLEEEEFEVLEKADTCYLNAIIPNLEGIMTLKKIEKTQLSNRLSEIVMDLDNEEIKILLEQAKFLQSNHSQESKLVLFKKK